jgi:hypothetical protein
MMGAGYPHLARINGWVALLFLTFLVALFWLARRSWERRERVRIKSRYVFDEYGRLVGMESARPDARECRHCGQPIAPSGPGWADAIGDRHCHQIRRGRVAVCWHEP